MKSMVHYGGASYGNEVNAINYTARLDRTGSKISVSFAFAHPIPGRGVGPNRGQVHSVSLGLSPAEAYTLARALLALGPIKSYVEYRVGQEIKDTGEQIKLVS